MAVNPSPPSLPLPPASAPMGVLNPLAGFHASIGGILGASKPLAPTTSSSLITAPLGGLPAMASQIAATQKAMVARINEEKKEQSEQEEEEPDVQSVTPPPPPATPPPTSSATGTPTKEGSEVEDTPPKQSGLIKAKGTYYPLSAFPTSMPQGTVLRKENNDSPPKTDASSSSAGESTQFSTLETETSIEIEVAIN